MILDDYQSSLLETDIEYSHPRFSMGVDEEGDDAFDDNVTCKKYFQDDSVKQGNDDVDQRKINLEKRWRRRLVWGSASSAVAVGDFLTKIGIQSAYFRVMRLLLMIVAGYRKLRLPQVEYSESVIAGVNVRVYRPVHEDCEDKQSENLEKLPCLVYCHGGGWMMGSAKSYHSLTARLCRDVRAIVISVDYRLAPEYPYPAALEDCYAVTRTVLNCDSEGRKFADSNLAKEIDSSKVILAGDSAGGNLAGAVSLELVRHGNRRLHACALICPVTQAVTMSHDSSKKFTNKYGQANLAWFLSIYAGVTPSKKTLKAIYKDRHIPDEQHQRLINYVKPNGPEYDDINNESKMKENGAESIELTEDMLIFKNSPEVPLAITELVTSVRAWPLLADDEHLAQLPRTMVQSCSHDVLLDENKQLVDRLRRCGSVKVDHSLLQRAEHCEGINCGIFRSKVSRQGYGEIVTFLKHSLQN